MTVSKFLVSGVGSIRFIEGKAGLFRLIERERGWLCKVFRESSGFVRFSSEILASYGF